MLIQKIDDTTVTGKTTQECLTLMKGDEGTTVRMEVLDVVGQESRTVELTRARFLTSSTPVR